MSGFSYVLTNHEAANHHVKVGGCDSIKLSAWNPSTSSGNALNESMCAEPVEALVASLINLTALVHPPTFSELAVCFLNGQFNY